MSLNALTHSSTLSAAFGSLPNIQILKHNQRTIDKMINGKRHSPFNHNYSGASCLGGDVLVPKSFRILNESIVVGHGIDDFNRASQIMSSFEMVNAMPWANVVLSAGAKGADLAVGTVLCTLIKCYKTVWTLNPCRVCHISRSSDVPSIKRRDGVKFVDQIAYSTVDGHLISGEERFRVMLTSDDDVVFDIYSFTKGAGVLGTLAMPFIRPIQGAFFRDVTLTMKKLMSANLA